MSIQMQNSLQVQPKGMSGGASRSNVLRRAAITPMHSNILQRCSNGVECADCRAKRLEHESLQRAAVDASSVNGVPPIVHDVLNSSGQPLDAGAKAFMEPRFGHDFTGVRVHTDARAAESARSVNALAYTVGRNVVFGMGQYAPGTGEGKRLLAHELTHVVQQGNKATALNTKLIVSATNDTSEQEADATADRVMRKEQVGTIVGLGSTQIQRVPCLPDAICKVPTPLHPDAPASIAGSAEAFGAKVETAEEAARKRRAKMTPARAKAHGHGGKASALEWFLDNQSPGLRTNIHGIFVDQDMDRDVEATTEPCDQFVPPILGATKPCVFIHDYLNQEAFTFIKEPHKPIIGGLTREDWRVQTLQTLTHEIQHVKFDNEFETIMNAFEILGLVKPSVTCSRDEVEQELTELGAIMSEFPVVFRAIPSGADPANTAHIRLKHWFSDKIDNPNESIRGSLTKMRCKCSCPDANRHVIEIFIFTSALWSQAEKDAFNAELRKPVWNLDWPL